MSRAKSRTAPPSPLSRRERQLMDIVYRLGRATSVEVREAMSDPPSYSAVRALLRILETKGHLRHEQDGARYVFLPTVPAEDARLGALDQVIDTFFQGSASEAMAALLDSSDRRLNRAELNQIARLIAEAKKEGR
jgi:BlaI family transcriptional regulator, penicillinase repressor